MANQDTPAALVKANAQLAESGPTDNEWIHVKDIKHEAYKIWENQDRKQERNKRNVRETKCTARRISPTINFWKSDSKIKKYPQKDQWQVNLRNNDAKNHASLKKVMNLQEAQQLNKWSKKRDKR